MRNSELRTVFARARIYSQFVGDDAHIVPKSAQISVGNAVLSVPKTVTKICADFGTMWASSPTKCRRKLTATLASFGKGGGTAKP